MTSGINLLKGLFYGFFYFLKKIWSEYTVHIIERGIYRRAAAAAVALF
jgi:hypothetical protein